ncbi:MAG: hypothetical protein FWC93_00435 [Defluviitaleaceae bacterium]|nr:hypothetical protein [Defluviitaleaceae bacterium]
MNDVMLDEQVYVWLGGYEEMMLQKADVVNKTAEQIEIEGTSYRNIDFPLVMLKNRK